MLLVELSVATAFKAPEGVLLEVACVCSPVELLDPVLAASPC